MLGNLFGIISAIFFIRTYFLISRLLQYENSYKYLHFLSHLQFKKLQIGNLSVRIPFYKSIYSNLLSQKYKRKMKHV